MEEDHLKKYPKITKSVFNYRHKTEKKLTKFTKFTEKYPKKVSSCQK
jgi:hypothetical protein